MSEELHLTDVSSTKITSPPESNHINNINTDILMHHSTTTESVVVKSDSMAQGSTVVRKLWNRNVVDKIRNHNTGVKRQKTSSNGDTTTSDKEVMNSDSRALASNFVDNERNRKTGIKRRKTSSNCDTTTTDKEVMNSDSMYYH
jgi:hypothetical protein